MTFQTFGEPVKVEVKTTIPAEQMQELVLGVVRTQFGENEETGELLYLPELRELALAAYALNETNDLIRQSMALSIMGNMDAAEATESITSALKGYSLEAKSASDIVDKFFAVDMAAATSSSKLAVALSKCAANAKLAGISMDDLIGQIAVVSSITQEAGESTGGRRLAA